MKELLPEVAVLLHDIRSVHNVGSIFRTADAAGVTHIYMSGHTPLPVDRFGRARKDLAKVALGAEQTIKWEETADPAALVTQLKSDGYRVIGIEQDDRAQDYKKISVTGKVLFLVGNEVDGMPADLLDLCDDIAEIPMRGGKESLNVSVAFGIALFRMLGV